MRKLTVFVLIFALLFSVSAALAQTTEEPSPVPTETVEATVVVTEVPTLAPTVETTSEPTQEATAEVTVTVTPTATTTATSTSTPTSAATVVGTLTATVVPTQTTALKLDTTPRIAVISAFAPEITALQAQVAVEQTFRVNGVDFTTGTLAGKEVVLFLSGESMVNAAMNTQLLIDHFNVTHIIFSGIAGGVNPAYHIGDVVIAAQWGQYEETLAARQLPDGSYAPPSFASTPFPNFNFWFPQNVNVRSNAHPEGESKFWFAVDPQMLAAAQSIASTVKLKQCTADNVCLTDMPQVHVGGSGVSGQTFVDNADYRDYVYKTFNADALDMETASAAMVAYANGVPFLAFRSLSDLAGGGPGENEVGTFFQVAADNSAAVTLAFLNAWPNQ